MYRQWLRVLPDDAVVVEVGSYLGQSAITWGAMARKLGRPIVLQCVDPFAGIDEIHFVDPAMLSEQRAALRAGGGSMRSAFDANVATAGVGAWISARTATSVEAAATFAPGTVDRVLIDGDHGAEAVAADLEAWWPTLKPGGELVGHDDDWPTVRDTVRGWAATRGLQVLPVSQRCWRLIKPSPVVSWAVPPAARVCLVAVACNERTIYRHTVKSLMALGWGAQVAKAMQAHGFRDVRFAWFDKGHTVDVLREQTALFALKSQVSHVLFLDADMTWPTTLLTDILAHHDKGIVSGRYHLKPWPHKPVAFHESAWNARDGVWDYTYDEPSALSEDLRPEHLIGMGCALIPTHAFERIPRPWFRYAEIGSTGLMTVSEDVWFCERAREAGVPIWLDPTISCGHVESHIVTEQDYFRAMFDAAHLEAGTTPALPDGVRLSEVPA